MHTLRNLVVLLGVLAMVVLAYPMVLTATGAAMINGGQFATYFGWFSWPHAIFALVLAVVFLIGGAILGRVITANSVLWALLLGVIYDIIRGYPSRTHFAVARAPAEIIWACFDLSLPIVA